jgi:hypothetical protein
MSTAQEHFLPGRKDVATLLEAARTQTESLYEASEYTYVRGELIKTYSNSLGRLSEGYDPAEMLIEALQGERNMLDRHNRREARALYRRDHIYDLAEQISNFPLRNICEYVILPHGFFTPIYQVNDDNEVKEAVQQARLNAVRALPRSTIASPPKSSDSSLEKGVRKAIGKCQDAPSPEHEFPDANITLAELAAFLPQSIKSWDVVDRIVWNGATTNDVQKMINKYRDMPYGKIDTNSVFLMMRGQMRKRTNAEHNYNHWKEWVVGTHEDIMRPNTFDADSISVTGFRRPIVFVKIQDEAAAPIPFKNLANGVAQWPEGDDAFDLTRCVAWCAENPEEEYFYPTDYQEVLSYVGGPKSPTGRHTDAEVLSRLRAAPDFKSSRPRKRWARVQDSSDEPADEITSRTAKRKARVIDSSDESVEDTAFRTAKRRKTTSTKARTPRTQSSRQPRSEAKQKSTNWPDDSDSGLDTDDESYVGPKRVKKGKGMPRRSGRAKKTANYDLHAMGLIGEEDDIKD